MSNRKRSVNNLLSAGLGQLLAIFIGFMLPRLFIMSFGSAVNGLISSINQILMYLVLFEAGVGAVALQALYGRVAKKDWQAINGVLSATHIHYKRSSLFYLLALVAISAGYPLMVQVELPYLSVVAIILLCGLPSVLSFYVQAKYVLFLKAEGKNYIITNLGMLVTVLVGMTKAGLILLGVDVVMIILASFFIHLIPVVYVPQYVKRHYTHLSVNTQPDHEAISQKNYMLVHQISGMVFQNTDILLLSAVAGLKVASVYTVYKLIMSQMNHLAYIIQSSFDFLLGQTFQTDREKYLYRIDIFESYFSALMFSLFAVLLLVLESFVRMYTRGVTDITYADKLLVYLFVGVELLSIMRMPMLQTINYAGHFKKTTPQSVAEMLINLTVSLLGVFRYGIYGVLGGTIVALLYRTNDVIIYTNRTILERSPWRTYRIHLINIGAFLLVSALFSKMFGPIDSILSLLTTSTLATVVALPVFFAAQSLAWRENRAALRRHARVLIEHIRVRCG